MKVTEFDIQKIDDELLNILRYRLNHLDKRDRVEEKILPTITTTTSQIYFINDKLNYVKSVELDGNNLRLGYDYDIIWRDNNRGSIELKTSPTAGLDLDIEYGEVGTNGSFVYPDLPRNDISLGKMPRVGFRTSWSRNLVGGDGRKLAIGNEGFIQVKVIAESTSEVNKIITELDKVMLWQENRPYYIRYIIPSNIANYDNFVDNTDKPFFKVVEYAMPDKYQIYENS